MDQQRQSSFIMPGEDLYGNETMTPGGSRDPRRLTQQRSSMSRLQRRRSGLDLTPPANDNNSPTTTVVASPTPANAPSRAYSLTRQQSEGGGATVFHRRESVRRLQRRQFTSPNNLSRSQTEIRFPSENSHHTIIDRGRSRSLIRWSRPTNSIHGMFSLDASAAGSLLFSPSVSREGSANTLNATITGEPSVTSSTTSSGWRRFSSSIARFWGGSDSTSRGQEDEQQQQQTNDQQQPFECFQDCLEGPLLSTTSATTPATNAAAPVIGSSSSSSSAMARHSSMNNMNTPAATTPTSLVVEEDAAEEATIPNNDAPSNTQPTGMGREDEDEDPEALLCPICRDVLNSVAVTACGHTFCYPCISQYVASSPDCPICRSRLTQQQILPNYQFSDLVELYKEEKRRGSQSLLRSVQAEPKRNNAALLETLLKDLPYKDVLALLQPAVARKKQEEVDRKVAETLLLEEFLAKLKEKHKSTINELKSQIKVIDHDLVRAKDKRHDVYMEGVEGSTSDNPLLKTGEDATVAGEASGSSSNSHSTLSESLEQAHTVDSSRRAGHKRKIQELLGLSGDETQNDIASQTKRQRLYERFESLHELYLKEACLNNGAGAELPVHYDLDKLSSLLYETTRFSSFRVLDTLFHNDSTSSSIISSIEFDRDDEFFAMAGVSREIKLFDASMIADAISIQDDTMDDLWPRGNRDARGSGFIGQFQPSQLVHCPVKVIPVGQKISCLSWNMYVKSHIASSDYEGIIRVWDVNEGQAIRTFDEHEKRTWSVDMCSANPTYLASGGDDSTVKIWSTSMAHSVMTLRFNGNVCCAKFAPNVANYLAVGTADHSVTCYDLRYTATPVQSFTGHKKAVSYVRWIGDNQIISASTDNTLRRWDNTNGECQLVYSGHTNEKNFVGLSVSKDWISCGSEDNTVYAYHKDCKTPIAKYRFPTAPMPFYDPQYTQEDDQPPSGFVSSTCWKSNTNTLLTANSKGIIKVLQMIP